MMRGKHSNRVMLAGVGLLAASLVACSQQTEQTAGPQVEEKSFALSARTAVKTSFLAAELQDMQVTKRVEQGTEKVVDPPKLRGTLKLRNTSEDRAIRLIGGKIEYVDVEGKLIPLGEGRGDTSFSFYSYQGDRVDPGNETTQSIDVPFPAAALTERKLRDIRLELAYIPFPYKEETVSIPVSLGQ